MHLFLTLREKDGEPTLNPIALTVLVVTDDHVNKTVLNPGSGTWVKGRDELPEWLKTSVKRME